MYATHTDSLMMHRITSRFAVEMGSIWKKIRDFTFPHVAYFSGEAFNRTIVKVFEDVKIEDMWLPFYCVTTDLTDSKEVAHRNGTAWRYVRASMTLTGWLPPMCDVVEERVHYLVDGGYMNELPARAVRCRRRLPSPPPAHTHARHLLI